MDTYNFQNELVKSVMSADDSMDKKELLIDIFKTYVAKLFEIAINKAKTKDRIPYGALIEIKKNLISEFRAAALAEYQMSVKQYEELFDTTVQEIVNFAGGQHAGIDKISTDSNLEINMDAYQANSSGIYLPK